MSKVDPNAARIQAQALAERQRVRAEESGRADPAGSKIDIDEAIAAITAQENAEKAEKAAKKPGWGKNLVDKALTAWGSKK